MCTVPLGVGRTEATVPSMDSSDEITRLLKAWQVGEEGAVDQLLSRLYEHLREQAHLHLRKERAGHTLDTTGLVHEAYLRLAAGGEIEIVDRSHFLALASRAMRRVLVDYARARRAAKRGGGERGLPLREELVADDDVEKLIELDDALGRLEASHPRPAKALELHYFAGLTLDEAGDVLGVSAPTVMRDLRFAEAWLAARWNATKAQ